MNVAILRGRLSSAPRTTQLASGDELVRYEVTVAREDAPADTVPVAWLSPRSVPKLDTGDEVVVVGRVRRRFFGGGGGPSRSSTESGGLHRAPGEPTRCGAEGDRGGRRGHPDRRRRMSRLGRLYGAGGGSPRWWATAGHDPWGVAA